VGITEGKPIVQDEDSNLARDRVDYRSLTKKAADLISPPDVCRRVRILMDDPAATVESIAQVIECDPGLTGRILKIANSRREAGSDSIESVGEALEQVGVSDVRGMIFATVAASTFEQIPEDFDDFWHHSVCCGLAAQVLAGRCRLVHGERLFTAGLLHDIGQLPIYDQLPDLARRVLDKAGEPEKYRYRAEQEIIGFTHAQVGAELMRWWQLPDSLWGPVEFHHEPARASRFPVETAIIHIATNIANAIEPSWKTTGDLDISIRAINSDVWSVTGLSKDDLEPVLSEVIMRSFDVMETINPNALNIY